MAERIWTDAQKAAIDHDGGNLIVSAAAGSGKTATLTERIVRLITDKEQDICRMLVVTFTKAAANEVRERIRAELSRALMSDRKNKHLTRQLSLLPKAEICTIHSFCLKLIRSRFAELELPPDFGVADEGSCRVMKKRAMRDAVGEYYEAAATGGDTLLADVLGGSRNEDALDTVLLSFAENLTSHGFGGEKLLEYASDLEKSADMGFLASPHGERLKATVLRILEYYINVFTRSVNAFKGDEALAKAYLPSAAECLDFSERLSRVLVGGDYTASRDLIRSFKPKALGKLKDEKQTDESLYFKSAKEAFLKELGKLGKQYFAMSAEQAADSMRVTARVCRAAAPIIIKYFDRYSAAKRERGAVDFGDLENLACSLLYNKDGTLSDAACECALKYDHIFIDEYQDTNYTQDKIFSAVGAVCGRFLVGDIKQSIYRFRGAEPEVFASYRAKWDGDDDGSSVFMSENFRCDETVVDFVNLVSRYVFRFGSVPFGKEDELIHAKREDSPVPRRAEVILVRSDADSADTDNEAIGDAVNPEAEYVASRIASMIGREITEGGRTLRGGDIAILLRSPSSASGYYASALARRGIRTTSETKTDFFSLPEILLALSVMNAVDNPMRDIYLAGAMRSPVFSFNADELALIRGACRDTSLWQSVRKYAEEGDEPLKAKCAEFVIRLGKLRRDVRDIGADEALRLIYRETGLTEFDYKSPAARSNLNKLYDMARKAESGVFSGLYGFLAEIAELIENGENAITLDDAPDPDAVHILSIHHSKGLEYPVCFLSDCSRKFNLTDSRSNLLFDTKFGPAMRLPDETGLVRIDTPVRQAAAIKIIEDTADEEMRDLYVAMTRARCSLIVTAKVKSPEEKYAAIKNSMPYLCRHTVYGASSYIDWILGAIASGEDDACELKFVDTFDETKVAAEDSTKTEEEQAVSYLELIKERLSFEYPYSHLKTIPAKLTVSKLSPDILDSEDEISLEIPKKEGEQEGKAEQEQGEKTVPVPRFLTGDMGYTPAEAGIATHLFMQFCDFQRIGEGGAEAELKRLVEMKFLSPEIAERVNMREIAMFRGSELFSRILTAKEIRREFRFNAAMPAERFTAEPELAARFAEHGSEVIVQGVIDCVITDSEGKLVLIDYKTDHFRRGTSRDEARAALAERHGNQLGYYREICELMFKRAVDETYVYSLALGETVEIK